MSYDPKARMKIGQYETELKIPKDLDLICSPPGAAALHRLNLLKEQLRTLFLRLERRELYFSDAKAQSLHFQEELSKVIWAVDDWQIQFAGRN